MPKAAATSATCPHPSRPATARRRGPRAGKDAPQDPRRGARRIRRAGILTKARSSGSPAAPASRSAPSTPISTARRRCSRRWSATCRDQVRDHVAPALAGAPDELDARATARSQSYPRLRRATTRKSTGSSTRPSSSIRKASGPITRRPPSALPRGSRRQRTAGEVGRTDALATEVEAWAIMGMNVFLGLRFGVWGKRGSRTQVADDRQSPAPPRACSPRRRSRRERARSASISVLVMVEREADAKHVAAHVGDAVARLELARTSAARPGRGRRGSARAAAVERIEQLGARPAQFRPCASSKRACRRPTCAEIARGGQAVLPQHPPDGIEAVERRRVERRAHEPHRILGDSRPMPGGSGQVLELGEPAGDRRPRAEAGRAVQEGACPRPPWHICSRRRGRMRTARRRRANGVSTAMKA